MQENRQYRDMTVAHIREREGADAVEVIFLESARFYRLLKSHPAFNDILKQLRDAIPKGHTVTIGLASLDSDIIEEVQVP